MRCLYAVLECAKNTEDSIIKKNYRKLALQWHPDKNAHRAEEANERFQEIQNAWEVLSEPQERAWYDSHRDQILKGGSNHQAGGTGDVGAPECPYDPVDFSKYMSRSCFKGYGDQSRSFYNVYSAVFDKLFAQEQAAFECQVMYTPKLSKPREAPSFGGAQAEEKDLKSFYSFWSNFQTIKDFAWEDTYNPASALSRKIRRLMEDDNAKKRKSAKLAYVQSVRHLVEAVKPRDQRWDRIQNAERERKERQIEEDLNRRTQEKLAKQSAADAYWESDRARREEEEALLEAMDVEAPAMSSYQMFECIVCDKMYKTERALHNHNNSKKHKDQLRKFKAIMIDEDDITLLDDLTIQKPPATPCDASHATAVSFQNQSSLDPTTNSEAAEEFNTCTTTTSRTTLPFMSSCPHTEANQSSVQYKCASASPNDGVELDSHACMQASGRDGTGHTCQRPDEEEGASSDEGLDKDGSENEEPERAVHRNAFAALNDSRDECDQDALWI